MGNYNNNNNHNNNVVLIAMVLAILLRSIACVNVVSFGAKADGKTDSSKAFEAAWSKACASPAAAAVVVPSGRFFVKKAFFSGPCRSPAVTFRISGTILAPSDYRVTGDSSYWISFQNVHRLTVSGGILDGRGGSLWSCKSSGKSCPVGATTLGFLNSKNIEVNGVTSINSQLFHIVFYGCEGVKVQGAHVSASGDSPNTDGIHVEMSRRVTILDSRIGTGDDCVSVGPGTEDLWIERLSCGPGHGVSIGSLGRGGGDEPGVRNVTVRGAVLSGTRNGLRIKTWGRPGSGGFARRVRFEHAVMAEVENPIIIDQNYCPDAAEGCLKGGGKGSGVRISDVVYRDVRGSSATEVAVKFDCSGMHPCLDIRLEDVKLTFNDKPALASCSHAAGSASGYVQPSSCL